MGAHIEWLNRRIGILRVGRHFVHYGDEYEFACVVERNVRYRIFLTDTATFKGGNSKGRAVVVSERDAVRRELLLRGIRWVEWTRIKGGRQKPFRFPVDKKIRL